MANDAARLEKAFAIEEKSYTQQFSQIYYQRLQTLKPFVVAACKQKWLAHKGDTAPAAPCIHSRLLDLSPGVPSIIIGTLYFDLRLKPNVLRELSDPALTANLASAGLSLSDASSHGLSLPERVPFSRDTDKILLEDDSGRVTLSPSLIEKAPFLVSGVVIGLLGVESELGEFHVHDYCTADLAPQPPRTAAHGRHRLAILSGLCYGADMVTPGRLPSDLKLDLVLAFLAQTSQDGPTRLVLAGSSCSAGPPSEALSAPLACAPPPLPCRPKSKATAQQRGDLTALRLLDATFADSSLLSKDRISECYMMPGEGDLANRALPQQPIHPGLFPLSTKMHAQGISVFKSASNPCLFDFGGALVLGSSGQTLDDMYRFAQGQDDQDGAGKAIAWTDRLSLAEWSLRWRHIAPTAPDTLWCYPFYEKDPFILSATPHIYFVANQPEFATKLVLGATGQQIRIVLVPAFASTGILVLVDPLTLDCWPVCLDTGACP